MKDLKTYILEAEVESEDNEEKTTERGNIKYTIWLEPKKKVKWLEEGQKFQKIEYQHRDKDKGIYIDFLLGYIESEKTWKLWIGKIGSLSYDDDPYCDLETETFDLSTEEKKFTQDIFKEGLLGVIFRYVNEKEKRGKIDELEKLQNLVENDQEGFEKFIEENYNK